MRTLIVAAAAVLAGVLVGCGPGQPAPSATTPTVTAVPSGVPATAPPVTAPAPTLIAPPSSADARAFAEAACAEAFPDDSRNACIDNTIEQIERGSTMTHAQAEADGFPYRVCVWPDGFWTLSPRAKSGTIPIGSYGCGIDGKAKVTGIIDGP